MAQVLLPLIPDGATSVNECLSIVREDGQWTYFYGLHPVFAHGERDRRSFRMFSAQLVVRGMCKQADIVGTFGVSKNSVKRSVKKYREGGIEVFYRARQGRGGTVMKPAVITRAQALLDRGCSRTEAASELGIKYDTLRKAIEQGRLRQPSQGEKAKRDFAVSKSDTASDKSARSLVDAVAEMGTACTRPDERVLAALGLLDGAPTRFETCRDVSFGGVLCALPALAENGLFRHLPRLPSLSGYYSTLHVIILLAYMALCRIKTVEQLQYEPPGELGKLLGLDRVPEVRCLRRKLAALSEDDAPQHGPGCCPETGWRASRTGRHLVRRRACSPLSWPSNRAAPTLCLPPAVVSAGDHRLLGQRCSGPAVLCGRTADRPWAFGGVAQRHRAASAQGCSRPADRGGAQGDRYRSRFVILFDREGYSPEFFKEMWQTHRIACITYHKYPKNDWPEPGSRRSKRRCRAANKFRCNWQSGARGSATRRAGSGYEKFAS